MVKQRHGEVSCVTLEVSHCFVLVVFVEPESIELPSFDTEHPVGSGMAFKP